MLPNFDFVTYACLSFLYKNIWSQSCQGGKSPEEMRDNGVRLLEDGKLSQPETTL